MWQYRILRTGEDEDNNDSPSNNTPLENVASNNDDLNNVQLTDSQNDRVSIADDPFRRVVEFGDDGNVDADYYVEYESVESVKRSRDSDYELRALSMMPDNIKDGYNPIPDLQIDFASFGTRVKGTIFRVLEMPNTSFSFFDDLDSYRLWTSIPDSVYQEDAKFIEKFQVLHDTSKYMKYVNVHVANQIREFSTFHYEDPENTTNERRSSREYLDYKDGKTEPTILYRYDMRAAVCLCFQETQIDSSEKRKMRNRFYVTYCRLSCNDNDRFGHHRFTLISILTTLCLSPYNIYVVWDNLRGCVLEWKDETFLKFFWCDYDGLISDEEFKYLESRLEEYFTKNLYLYDYDRNIPRDYHNVGKSFIYYHFIYQCFKLITVQETKIQNMTPRKMFVSKHSDIGRQNMVYELLSQLHLLHGAQDNVCQSHLLTLVTRSSILLKKQIFAPNKVRADSILFHYIVVF
jgi:hypothetical protein